MEQSRELQSQLEIRKSREVSLMFQAPPSLSLLSINSRRGKREVEQLSRLFETCSRRVNKFLKRENRRTEINFYRKLQFCGKGEQKHQEVVVNEVNGLKKQF